MSARSADLILLGGPIHTVGPAGRVEALAVSDGIVRAVGREDEVLEWRGLDTEIVDLDGGSVLPGLIEPHTHPDLCAQCYSWVDVSGFRHGSDAEVESALAAAVDATATGEWIFAFGLDPMLTSDLGVWDRARLDEISREHPIVVMLQSMHTLWVNSLALEQAGIGESTPDPGHGGSYGRDAAGRLTGKVDEMPAQFPFMVHLDLSEDALRSRMVAQVDRYRAAGITMIGMAGTFLGVDQFELYDDVLGDPAGPLRTVAYLRHTQSDLLAERPDPQARFRVAGVKLWYDGSPYTGTMLLDEPYLESDLCRCALGIPAGAHGQANFEPDEMLDLLRGFAAAGHQVLTHAQGDRGCREIVDLYAAVDPAASNPDHRWRIEHCALISEGDLARARSLGVSPSFHVNHVHYYGPELRDEIVGPERADRLMPIATAVRQGHRVSLHADSPMYPPEPLRLARTAATRLTRGGELLGEAEGVPVEVALRAITIDAAWQLGLDDEVGSLEVGKRADLTVLDRSPLDVDPRDLHQLEVRGTWVDGVPTHPA